MTNIQNILTRAGELCGEYGYEIALFLAGILTAVVVWAIVHPEDFYEIEQADDDADELDITWAFDPDDDEIEEAIADGCQE